MTISIMDLSATLSINDVQHNDTRIWLECHAEWRVFLTDILSVVVLNVIMLSDVAPTVWLTDTIEEMYSKIP